MLFKFSAQDPFTPDQRKLLEWQIQKYILICSNQKRLFDELHSNISRCHVNKSVVVAQNVHQPVNFLPHVKNVQTFNGHQPVTRTNSNLTIHQNIVVRQVDATRQSYLDIPSKHTAHANNSLNVNSDSNTVGQTFKVLPLSANSSTLQEQNSTQLNGETSSQTPASVETVTPANNVQIVSEATAETVKCGSIDSCKNTTSSKEIASGGETTCVDVKQEKKLPLLTDQEIETIDLTWINDIDPKQLQSEMEFIAVKKEEPLDEEGEEEIGVNEEPFVVVS